MTRPARDPDAALATGALPASAALAVTPHVLASRSALGVIAAGGTAVDAAIAADATLSVVAPDACGPGGDLFAIVYQPGKEQPAVLNASGRAGSRASASALRNIGLREIPEQSPSSITIPGCVDGWEALVGRFSNLTLADDLLPAIEIAREGFPTSIELAASLDELRALVGDQASAASLYPDGITPQAGTTLHRPALAETLEAICADGRTSFYLGDVGTGIIEATNGVVVREDLERTQAEWVTPAAASVFGLTAWTVPPNSQGWLTLATLMIFEMLDPPRDPADPGYQHALIEAYRSVACERADTTSDPDTAPLSSGQLLDRSRLSARAKMLDPEHIQSWPPMSPAPGGTAYLTTRDHAGMVVSFIQSNFWSMGSGFSAGATGVWLHNRGAGFDLRPGHPNELSPGRRPLHTLAPLLWTQDGTIRLALGTRGGDYQPQLLAQLVANQLWVGLDPDEAQQQPRWTIDAIASAEPPTVRYESRYATSTIDGLGRKGHHLEPAMPWESNWGPASIITVEDTVRGSADPRLSTSAALGVVPDTH